jgi:hypothetical protein
MASGRTAASAPTNHPVPGPSVSIYDDRNRSRGSLLFGLACILLGPLGIYWGVPDLARGDVLLGLVYALGGPILILYGAWSAFGAAGRLRHPVALVVGRDGFKKAGDEPVGWDEVGTIGDPASPADEPRIVRVQLIDPEGYAARHGLGPIARQRLRAHGGDLFLGRDMAMPVADVQALMRRRLAEYRRPAAAVEASAQAAETPRPRDRRPARKRR